MVGIIHGKRVEDINGWIMVVDTLPTYMHTS